jgi:hypothetical protein
MFDRSVDFVPGVLYADEQMFDEHAFENRRPHPRP